ncbi:hypothetical protein PK28_03140 [Hymenobacter sp. DG25B]|uniref:DUF4249 domain-containing protein n=1 Tax=Hymenobacter sp. DG25B TaxID=1385664 RepID=UPI00054114EA|nr:DUF4249 domain-containing protein [Hymenobacter sp. DG25B]AIZ62929.1 hypothetical protein PK28_03140 [Hymenobacter sp. DG25B]
MKFLALHGRRLLLWSLIIGLVGCIDSYLPESISAAPGYLVVDGFINAQGISTITLTRAIAIREKTAAPQEISAQVAIEEEGGARYLLRETSPGIYQSEALTLAPARQYRLLLTTLAGKNYASDFVPVRLTPAIDSVTWQGNDEGVAISVSTHDDQDSTRFYRWDYEETWEIAPLLRPDIEFKNGKIQDIEKPYPILCWRNAKSTRISLAKTTQLARDVVSKHLLQSITTTTERLNRTYSILVKQYAQTREEYSYWEMLQKNTENLGSLYDPLPVQLTGNVHGITDEQEVVLGYIGVHSVAEKRIFITMGQLPAKWRWNPINGYESCVPPGILDVKDAPHMFFGKVPYYVPVTTLYSSDGAFVVGYTYSTPDCVDCRLRGTDVKPDFWP